MQATKDQQYWIAMDWDNDDDEIKDMKFCVVFAFAAVAVVAASGADVKSGSRSNLSVGFIGPQDRLLRSSRFSRMATDPSWLHFYSLFAPSGTRINAVRATQVGSQSPTVQISRGGVGFEFVSFEFRNAPGRGLTYDLEIWGR